MKELTKVKVIWMFIVYSGQMSWYLYTVENVCFLTLIQRTSSRKYHTCMVFHRYVYGCVRWDCSSVKTLSHIVHIWTSSHQCESVCVVLNGYFEQITSHIHHMNVVYVLCAFLNANQGVISMNMYSCSVHTSMASPLCEWEDVGSNDLSY